MRIVNHDEYEKNQKFIVKLGDPRHITSDKPGMCVTCTRSREAAEIYAHEYF